MGPDLRIDVIRLDGEITRLEGMSGIAVCMKGPLSDPVMRSDPPTLALRCSTAAELAWNLAAMMGAVRHASPAAFESALELMNVLNFRQPAAKRFLP